MKRNGKYTKREASTVALSIAIALLRQELDNPSDLTGAGLHENGPLVRDEMESIVDMLAEKMIKRERSLGITVEELAPDTF